MSSLVIMACSLFSFMNLLTLNVRGWTFDEFELYLFQLCLSTPAIHQDRQIAYRPILRIRECVVKMINGSPLYTNTTQNSLPIVGSWAFISASKASWKLQYQLEILPIECDLLFLCEVPAIAAFTLIWIDFSHPARFQVEKLRNVKKKNFS